MKVIKKIVLIAGEPSHGPDVHEYDKTVRLLKVLLDQSSYCNSMKVITVSGGWPEHEETLIDADLVLFVTDGRDGDAFRDVPFVADERRMALMSKLMDAGCGLILLHFSTFFTRAEGKHVLEWAGGYFEWDDEQGNRNWYSSIAEGDSLALVDVKHPISKGVASLIPLQDEIYYQLRMVPNDARRTPIWSVPNLKGQSDEHNLVGWALEREGGGRSFVTTAGHSYALWRDDSFRNLHLQAILWAAGFDIPEEGIHSRFYEDDQVDQAIATIGDDGRARISEHPVRALVLSGNEEHRWHHWEETTPLIVAALHEYPNITAVVTTDAEVLGSWELNQFDVIVLNYCNWRDPSGLSERGKSALIRHMEAGRGLVVLHFANGAFHFSLPEAGESDWPEFREMVPYVWNHHGDSGHDDYGVFTVLMKDKEHPITQGVADFEVCDELYYRQESSGVAHAEAYVLYEADSPNTGRREQLAWISSYRGGRVYQSLLGHNQQAYEVEEVRKMLARGVLWTAGQLG